MWVFKLQRGFTLIELLIVMTLMGVVLSLVAPMGMNMVTKARAQTEYLQLQQKMNSMATHAFTQAQPLELVFDDNTLTSYRFDSVASVLIFNQSETFEFISFPEKQTVRFNRNGIPNTNSIDVLVRSNEKQLMLAN